MPAPGYINIEYIFYRIFLFTRESYFFIINLPWTKIHFWAQVIAAILIFFFVAGIIYNLAKIFRLKPKKHEEFWAPCNFAQPTGFEPAISAVTGQRFKPTKLRLHEFTLLQNSLYDNFDIPTL